MSKTKTEILVIFKESIDLISGFSDEQLGQILRALAAYRFYGEVTELEDPAAALALRFMTGQVDRYGDYCRQKQEAAKSRYRKQKENEAAEEEPMQKAAKAPSISMSESVSMSESMSESVSMSESMSVSESESMSISESKTLPEYENRVCDRAGAHTQFIPPDIETVRAYCRKNNIPVDPGRFVNYYNATGWKMGSSPITDWPSALRSWESLERNIKPKEMPSPWGKIGTRL